MAPSTPDAVLLAGGFGTRLRPLTYTRPKPLLSVAGRPMLEWMLDRLPPEVNRVIVAVNWQADALNRYFANSDRDLEFIVVRENEPLGTGGAVRHCRQHIRSDRFFVLNADIVSAVDLGGMLRSHEETGAEVTIATKDVAPEEVVNYGVVAPAKDDPRRIAGFVEKPASPADAPSHSINAGAYLLNRTTLDRIPPGMVSMEKDIFPHVLEAQGLWGVPIHGLWMDVGDPDRLLAASQAIDPRFIHDGSSRLESTVVDSILGSGCTVGPRARVVHSVLGDGVHVEAGAVLRNCVVGDGETVSGEHNGERIWSRPPPEGYPERQVGNVLHA